MHRWQYCINDFSLRLPCTRPDILRHHHLSSRWTGTLFHIINFSIHLHIGSTVRLPFGVRITRIINLFPAFSRPPELLHSQQQGDFWWFNSSYGHRHQDTVLCFYSVPILDRWWCSSPRQLYSPVFSTFIPVFLVSKFPPLALCPPKKNQQQKDPCKFIHFNEWSWIFHSMMTNLSADFCKRGYVWCGMLHQILQ